MRLLASRPDARRRVRACGRCERAALLAALDGRRVAPGPAGAPIARPRRRAADRPQPHLDRSARHPDPHRRRDRRARRRRGGAPLPAGSWRLSARAGDRSLGLGLAAHRRRRSRAGAGLSRRAAGLGQGLEPRHRHRGHAARRARPAAHRRDLAHLRPVPRHLRDARSRCSTWRCARVAALDEDDCRQSAGRGAPRRRRSRARVRRRARQLRRAGRRPGARRRLADARGARPGLSRGRHACLWRRRGDARRPATVSAPASPSADVLVHPQDDRERDLLDGDGVADFAGGFAAAAAMLGNTPELYHLDTSQPEAPKARRIAEEIARVVRGRLTNPRWLAGMLEHGHRGVAEIAQSGRCALCLRRDRRRRARTICSMRRTPR